MNVENWTVFDEVMASSFSMGQAVAGSSFFDAFQLRESRFD